MASQRLTLLAVALLVVGGPRVAAEVSWGDVSADGMLTNRFLDVPVATARGSASFFLPDPMESRDFIRLNTVLKSLAAVEHVAARVAVQGKMAQLEDALKPIFEVLPKNELGHYSNATGFYALHRMFTKRHGWTIKGLQPAGGAWLNTMTVTDDVRELTKYMVPSYLNDKIMMQSSGKSPDLRSFAIIAAALEHMIHADMLSTLYQAYAIVELSTAGNKSQAQMIDILEVFTMAYALGFNMEVSTLSDLHEALEHLERSHAGWRGLKELVTDSLQREQRSSAVDTLDFDGVLRVAEAIADGYSGWQGRDCARTKAKLAALPGLQDGRVPVSALQGVRTDGVRPLFVEGVDELRELGALDEAVEGQPRLIVPNYINSHAMCLSTATFYTVCCVNECEGLLGQIEHSAGAPGAEVEKVAAAAEALLKARAASSQGLSERAREGLRSLARDGRGLVSLHSSEFATWMHGAFPLECPLPHARGGTSPMTPDEWMRSASSRIEDTGDMMQQIAKALNRYTSLGAERSAEAADEEVPLVDALGDVLRLQERQSGQEEKVAASVAPRRAFTRAFHVFIMATLSALAMRGLRTVALWRGRNSKDKEPTILGSFP